MLIVSNQVLQFFRRDQSPGFVQVQSQLFIADAFELDANPTAHANVGRPVKFFRRRFDQRLLDTNRRRDHNRDVPVLVMIVGAHGEDFFADEESRLAMRKFLGGFRQRAANATDSLQMFFAIAEIS